jgi:nucleoid DNA-binding protein
MTTKSKLRQKIIKKIHYLPEDELGYIERFIDELENNIKSDSEILLYSGIFKDLDKEILDDLTKNLHNKNEGFRKN